MLSVPGPEHRCWREDKVSFGNRLEDKISPCPEGNKISPCPESTPERSRSAGASQRRSWGRRSRTCRLSARAPLQAAPLPISPSHIQPSSLNCSAAPPLGATPLDHLQTPAPGSWTCLSGLACLLVQDVEGSLAGWGVKCRAQIAEHRFR